ncbi:MAG: sigma-E processing peptidase SpoIIGA [Eubacteriales bacterium]
MRIVVYADILFLINFSMDFLTLWLTGKLTARRPSRVRLLASAALGSLSGTVSMFFIEGAAYVFCGLLTAVLMTRLAFGKYRHPARLLRDSVLLWGTGILLGGLMTSVLSLGSAVRRDGGAESFPAVFLLCFGLSALLIRLTRHTSPQSSAAIVVTADGVSISFTALCDSGCLLTEPITGAPVIIASGRALGPLAARLAEEVPTLRLRMIPAEGVCGHRLLRGFLPDRVTVNGKAVSAVIACDTGGTEYGGFDGIVPAKLTH